MSEILETAKRALELDVKASPGPWTFVSPNEGSAYTVPYVKSDAGFWLDVNDGVNTGNFIAFSREALPALAREVILLHQVLSMSGVGENIDARVRLEAENTALRKVANAAASVSSEPAILDDLMCYTQGRVLFKALAAWRKEFGG